MHSRRSSAPPPSRCPRRRCSVACAAACAIRQRRTERRPATAPSPSADPPATVEPERRRSAPTSRPVDPRHRRWRRSSSRSPASSSPRPVALDDAVGRRRSDATCVVTRPGRAASSRATSSTGSSSTGLGLVHDHPASRATAPTTSPASRSPRPKQASVDLGELEPGTYTITDGAGGAAPIEVDRQLDLRQRHRAAGSTRSRRRSPADLCDDRRGEPARPGRDRCWSSSALILGFRSGALPQVGGLLGAIGGARARRRRPAAPHRPARRASNRPSARSSSSAGLLVAVGSASRSARRIGRRVATGASGRACSARPTGSSARSSGSPRRS